MKKIFSFLLLAMFLATTSSSFSQVIKVFQPDPIVGNDAIIWSANPSTNYGSSTELVMNAWTNSSNLEIMRSLIKFNDLATIPTNIGIENAILYLYGTNSNAMNNQGNSWPNTNYTISSNELWIERITQSWVESLVTWSNQPQTVETNREGIPHSTSTWSWNYNTPSYSSNMITMVQNMVTNPSSNYGFMIKLQNENNSRNTFFKSSDYSDPKFRPTLVVTYSIPEFTYCFNSSNNQEYTFTSIPYASQYCYHIWTIDGTQVSVEPYFTLTLSSGTHQVCHTITYDGYNNDTYTTNKCVTICVY